MSADNGVYVLRTLDGNGKYLYRVKELQAVDNVNWDRRAGKETRDPKVMIKNAKEMWTGCVVFTSAAAAMKEAMRIYEPLGICEYGIQLIIINEVWRDGGKR